MTSLCYLIGAEFGAGFVDGGRIECWLGLRRFEFEYEARSIVARNSSAFAILMRAQNPPKCVGTGAGVGSPAGCDLSAAGVVLAGLGRGGAADRCDLAGARSGDSAIGWSGAFAARRAVAGIPAGLQVRDFVVCRDLLLDLRHHAPLWRAADSGRRAGADFVLHVRRALSRDVRAAAGLGCGIERLLDRSAAASGASIRRALVAAPFLWVAVELARTRITAFPWELLGYSQTANFALTRIATLTGVYGLSFEIVLVNSVFAAAFLVPRARRSGGSGCWWRHVRRRGSCRRGSGWRLRRSRPITPRFWCSRIFRFKTARCGRRNIFRTRCAT